VEDAAVAVLPIVARAAKAVAAVVMATAEVEAEMVVVVAETEMVVVAETAVVEAMVVAVTGVVAAVVMAAGSSLSERRLAFPSGSHRLPSAVRSLQAAPFSFSMRPLPRMKAPHQYTCPAHGPQLLLLAARSSISFVRHVRQ
jgi:hypothetical protein